jgi:hypothetical protein
VTETVAGVSFYPRHGTKTREESERENGRSLSVGRRDSSILNLLFFPSRLIFYFFGGSFMDSTVPADLLKLKDRLESWRATRKYARQPIPDEFRQAAADMAGRYSPSLVRRILKLDPWQLNKRTTEKPDRARTLTI